MKINTLEDHLKLEGGIKIEHLEPILVQIISLLRAETTNWKKGIAAINKVFHLKEHDDTRISPKTAQLILSWINEHYSSAIFQELDAFEELGESSDALHETIDLTFNTLSYISKVIDVIPFLKEKLAKATHDYEREIIEDEIEYISIFNNPNKKSIPLRIKRQIEVRANQYLNSVNDSEMQCALIETITEHEYSYSLGWCLASEKYISPVKRTRFAGGGPLYVSKISDAIEMAPSYIDDEESPTVSFELKIRNLEGYWCLEIEYQKKHISPLKYLLQLSTAELLNKKNEQGIIPIEGKKYELTPLKEDLERLNIHCALIQKERPITV